MGFQHYFQVGCGDIVWEEEVRDIFSDGLQDRLEFSVPKTNFRLVDFGLVLVEFFILGNIRQNCFNFLIGGGQ